MTKMLPNGRASGRGLVIVLPKSVFDTDEYRALSHRARTLLTFVHLTYSKYNNGSLRILTSEPERYGFRSKDLLSKARNELIAAGWLQVTRLPKFKRMPWLYALTWEAIDANPADGVKGTQTASNLWRSGNAGKRETFGRELPEPSKRRVLRAESPRFSAPIAGLRNTVLFPVAGKRNGNSFPVAGNQK